MNFLVSSIYPLLLLLPSLLFNPIIYSLTSHRPLTFCSHNKNLTLNGNHMNLCPQNRKKQWGWEWTQSDYPPSLSSALFLSAKPHVLISWHSVDSCQQLSRSSTVITSSTHEFGRSDWYRKPLRILIHVGINTKYSFSECVQCEISLLFASICIHRVTATS